jgi:hypothetical protein
VSEPSMAEIGVRQARDVNVRRQITARHFYKVAKIVHFGGLSLAIVLALVSPVVLLYEPDLGPTLGAIAALWIFVARLVLEPIRQAYQLKGATAQELFDCNVLGIGWNDALARRLADEEIRQASKSLRNADRRWYPADEAVPWPTSVLVCQRSNAVWARRQHVAYGWLLGGAAVIWVVLGIIIAVLHKASLGEYLTTVALPSLPAVLDAAEMSRGHRHAAGRRQELEDRADAALRSGAASQDLREIQDQLFELRKDAPLVPQWFYNLIKPTYEEGMRYAAERFAAGASSSTRSEGRNGAHGE